MARTEHYFQFGNAALGISPGSGTAGTTANPSAPSMSNIVTRLNAGDDVFVNRGGLATVLDAGLVETSVATGMFQITAAPSNLGRLRLWDGAGGSGVGKDPWTIDPGLYDVPVTSGTGGWTSIGDGKWTKSWALDFNPTFRGIWAQAVAGVSLSTTMRLELRQRISTATCVAVGDWHQVTGTATPTITMQTGGNTDAYSPARVFGGLVITGQGTRWARAVRLQACKRLEFEPFIIMHATLRTIFTASSSERVEDIYFDGLKVWGFTNDGIRLSSETSQTDHVGGAFRLRFKDAVISSGTRAEASAADYGTIQNWHAIQHCVAIWGQVGEVSFVNPTFYGARHGCIEVQTAKSLGADAGYPRNLEFYATTPGAATIDFPANDPKGYYNAFGTGTNGSVTISGFRITNVNKGAGVNGHARIVGNHWSNLGYCLAPGSSDDNGGVDWGINFDLRNNSTADYQVNTFNIEFSNNIMENPWNHPITINFQYDRLPPEHCLRITGNTIIDMEHFNERKRYAVATSGLTRADLSSNPSSSIAVSNFATGGTPGQYMTAQTLQDNIFITPSNQILSWSVNGGAGLHVLVAEDGVSDGQDAHTELVRTGNKHYTSTAAAGLSTAFVPDLSSGVVGAASSSTPRTDFGGKIRAIPGSVGAKEPA